MKLVINMEQLNKRIAYLYNLRKRKIEKILSKYNFNELEYNILIELRLQDEMSIDELIENLKMDPEVVRVVLSKLEKRECIEINGEVISLTKQIIREYRKVKKEIKKMDTKLKKNLSKKEYERLIDSLDILIENYEE